MALTIQNFAGAELDNLREVDKDNTTAVVTSTIATKHPWAGTFYYVLGSGLSKVMQSQQLVINTNAAVGMNIYQTNDSTGSEKIFAAIEGANEHFYLELNLGGIELFDSIGTSIGSTSTLGEDQWHSLEVYWKRGGSGTGFCFVVIDGTTRISDTSTGDYDAGGTGLVHYKWTNTTETCSIYVDDFWQGGVADIDDLPHDFYVSGPFISEGSDFDSGVGHEDPASGGNDLEIAVEHPYSDTSYAELETGQNIHAGCSTWKPDYAGEVEHYIGPRGNRKVWGATALAGKWIFKSSLFTTRAGNHDPWIDTGRQVDGSETTRNCTPTNIGNDAEGFICDDTVGSGTGCPDVDEWFQIGMHSGTTMVQSLLRDRYEYLVCTSLLTGGFAKPNASAGTIYGRLDDDSTHPTEVIAGAA